MLRGWQFFAEKLDAFLATRISLLFFLMSGPPARSIGEEEYQQLLKFTTEKEALEKEYEALEKENEALRQMGRQKRPQPPQSPEDGENTSKKARLIAPHDSQSNLNGGEILTSPVSLDQDEDVMDLENPSALSSGGVSPATSADLQQAVAACPPRGDSAWFIPSCDSTVVSHLHQLCSCLGVPERSWDFLLMLLKQYRRIHPSLIELWNSVLMYLKLGRSSDALLKSIIEEYILPLPPAQRLSWENPCLEQTDDIQEWMKVCVEKVAELWGENNVCAPYFALVQSSGSGKTTCMKQIGSMYPSVYIDCKKDPELLSKLKDICTISNKMDACAAMVMLLDSLFGKCSGKPDLDPKSPQVLLLDEARVWIETSANYKFDSVNTPKPESVVGGERSSPASKPSAMPIEESDTTRNAFHLLRKALRARYVRLNADKNPVDVVVLADTVSRVANFMPTFESQPVSLRHPHEHASVALFPAVTHFPSVNVFPTTENWLSFSNLCKIGRPLWYSSLLAGLTDGTSASKQNLDTQESRWIQDEQSQPREWVTDYLKQANAVLTLAQSKLLGNKLSAREEAFLGSRLCIQGFRKHTTTDLIAHSLAYCTFVSEDREVISCDFVAEPVVSEAAVIFSQSLTASKSWSSGYTLQCIQRALKNQTVEVGRLGEVIGQIVLLEAYDACIGEIYPARKGYLVRAATAPITLMRFLSKLLPKTYMSLLTKQEGLFTHESSLEGVENEEYCVFFNHFDLLTEPLSSDLLTQGLRSASAFQNTAGTPGSDLTIPLYGNRTRQLIGALNVQVNTSASESPALRTDSIVNKLEWGTVCGHNEDALCDLEHLQFFGVHLSLRAKRGEGSQSLEPPLLLSSLSKNVICGKHPDIYIRATKEISTPHITKQSLLERLEEGGKLPDSDKDTDKRILDLLKKKSCGDLKLLLQELQSTSKAQKKGHLINAVLKTTEARTPRYPACNVVLFLKEVPLEGLDMQSIHHLLALHSSMDHGYSVMNAEARSQSLQRIKQFKGENPITTLERKGNLEA